MTCFGPNRHLIEVATELCDDGLAQRRRIVTGVYRVLPAASAATTASLGLLLAHEREQFRSDRAIEGRDAILVAENDIPGMTTMPLAATGRLISPRSEQSVLPQGTRTARCSCCLGGDADVRCRAWPEG
jgi:hypothetical protein